MSAPASLPRTSVTRHPLLVLLLAAPLAIGAVGCGHGPATDAGVGALTGAAVGAGVGGKKGAIVGGVVGAAAGRTLSSGRSPGESECNENDSCPWLIHGHFRPIKPLKSTCEGAF